jgi:autophagy-related protein 11
LFLLRPIGVVVCGVDPHRRQAAFKEVGQRQEAAFRELRIARRIPRVYRACLAEVARRAAHAQLFSGQARQLAERMARSREREVARRDAFARSHERYLPTDVVAGAVQAEMQLTLSLKATWFWF